MTPSPAPQAPDVDQASGQLSPPVLDALAGQLDTRARQRKAEADRARAAGGPCSRCGAVESWEVPGRKGGWAGGDQHGAICLACEQDRGGPAGDDRDHRIKAARLVLGDTPAPPWAGHGASPAARWWHDDYLAEAMPWWHEVPSAPPGQGAQRFAYLTGEALVARLYEGREPKPATRHSRGKRHRCEGCGCKGECWWVTQDAVPAPVSSDGTVHPNRAYFRLTWTCHSCRRTEVEQRPTQLPGVPVRMLPGDGYGPS